MLKQSGLSQFLDPQGFASDHDAGVAKPNPEIYRLAAQRAGVEISRCLFVGDQACHKFVSGTRCVSLPHHHY
jgi:putative hydrolase of the HAD superfamily